MKLGELADSGHAVQHRQECPRIEDASNSHDSVVTFCRNFSSGVGALDASSLQNGFNLTGESMSINAFMLMLRAVEIS